ncbi:MAG: quinone oxidoreductase family protein, partial [Actinomycetota bacterium]
MRAVVIDRNGGPDVLMLEDRPTPGPRSGQLLVDVGVAGVNYRDIYEREGRGGYGSEVPLVVGVEGAGTVRAVGPGVEEFSIGDRVAWAAAPGSYAEHVVVDAARAVAVPPEVTDEQAAAAMVQGITAHYLSHSVYPVSEGDAVLVHAAAGGVGLLLTQMVKLRDGRVLGTVSTEEKAELVRRMGADEVLGYEGFADRARELTDDQGVAAVYDGVGMTTFEQSLASLRPRGYMVLYGAASGPAPSIDPARLAAGSLFLTRPVLHHYTASRAVLLERTRTVLGWIAEGKVEVRIGGRYSLEQARQAHEDLEGRRTTGK